MSRDHAAPPRQAPGRHGTSHPLRSTLALLEREAARRAKGGHPGMMRLQDDELGALLDLLRREGGSDTSSENTSDECGIGRAEEPTR